MQNQDIFKQAIAEAKSVREAAIANAKESIEESLTPHLKELLAAKLREMEETDEDLTEAEHTEEEETMEEVAEEVVAEEEAENDTEESEDDAEDTEATGEEEEVEADADTEGEEEEGEVDLETLTVDDLRNMIRDIVAQETAPGADMDMDMSMDAPMEPGVDDMVGLDEPSADEEEIDLDELLAELESLAGEGVEEADTLEMKKPDMKEKKSYMEMKKKKSYMEMKDKEHNEMKHDLQEAINTINQLQKDLSEVNLLNSKLLFVNKLFKSKNLSEAQKAHVIATFDKAETAKEAKLVYESFKTSFNKSATPSKSTQIKEHRSFASKATGVTSTNRPTSNEGVIDGVSEQVRRMQKLAGII